MPLNQGFRYEELSSGSLGESEQDDDYHRPQHRGPIQRWPVYIVFNTALCSVSLVLLLITLSLRPTQLQCAKIVSPYSPIWDAVQFWEGNPENFFNHTSIYRGPPTLERETAWDKLWRYKTIPVDGMGLKALNKSGPIKFVQVKDSDPNNPTYGANLEVFHQLHCLNVVRQATWPLDKFDPSWDLYPQSLGEPLAARMHIDHCLEELRMSLMCYADITPVLTEIDESRKVPRRADFNVHRKCRDFGKIADYVRQHGVSLKPL